MLESVFPVIANNWPIALSILLVGYLLSNYFNHGLNKYPGPFLAKFTNWWRFFDVYGRRPDITHLKLHRELGDVVRLGPNSLSFANPKALKTIYGLNKGFTKVRLEVPAPGLAGTTLLCADSCRIVRFLSRSTSREGRQAVTVLVLDHR